MIGLNPDFYTLWNYRKDIVNAFVEAGQDKASLCQGELDLTETAFRKNPKAYSAWTHREWVIDQGVSDMDRELTLCAKMLSLDHRNFHCWNYRRYVAARIGWDKCMQSEFDFSRQKINENFSNYSAWHYRSVLIPMLLATASAKEKSEFLDKEFELVKQAFFTEPEDQSAWLYHRWLLSRVFVTGVDLPIGISLGTPLFDKTPSTDKNEALAHESQIRVLQREIASCRELCAVESGCKWVLLTLAVLLGGLEACSEASSSSSSSKQENITEVCHIFEELRGLDPLRSNYYEHLSQRLMLQMR